MRKHALLVHALFLPNLPKFIVNSCGFSFLQNVPPAILLRFLREHRSEWADRSIDAYSAAAIKAGPCGMLGSRAGSFGDQVILPLAHTIEHEEVGIWY